MSSILLRFVFRYLFRYSGSLFRYCFMLKKFKKSNIQCAHEDNRLSKPWALILMRLIVSTKRRSPENGSFLKRPMPILRNCTAFDFSSFNFSSNFSSFRSGARTSAKSWSTNLLFTARTRISSTDWMKNCAREIFRSKFTACQQRCTGSRSWRSAVMTRYWLRVVGKLKKALDLLAAAFTFTPAASGGEAILPCLRQCPTRRPHATTELWLSAC